MHLEKGRFNIIRRWNLRQGIIFFFGDAGKDEVLQMGKKIDVFFFEEINEVILKKFMYAVLVTNPGTIFLFDDINVVASPMDNCG